VGREEGILPDESPLAIEVVGISSTIERSILEGIKMAFERGWSESNTIRIEPLI
jgi:hypothetical protein